MIHVVLVLVILQMIAFHARTLMKTSFLTGKLHLCALRKALLAVTPPLSRCLALTIWTTRTECNADQPASIRRCPINSTDCVRRVTRSVFLANVRIQTILAHANSAIMTYLWLYILPHRFIVPASQIATPLQCITNSAQSNIVSVLVPVTDRSYNSLNTLTLSPIIAQTVVGMAMRLMPQQ